MKHAVCNCRFVLKRRQRHWTEVYLGWRPGMSPLLTRWITKASSPFLGIRILFLHDAALDVRDLSALRCLHSLRLDACKLIIVEKENPWPLLSSGSRTLKDVYLDGCTTIEWTDDILSKGVLILVVRGPPCPPPLVRLYCLTRV